MGGFWPTPTRQLRSLSPRNRPISPSIPKAVIIVLSDASTYEQWSSNLLNVNQQPYKPELVSVKTAERAAQGSQLQLIYPLYDCFSAGSVSARATVLVRLRAACVYGRGEKDWLDGMRWVRLGSCFGTE
jgi:hypothetical protein